MTIEDFLVMVRESEDVNTKLLFTVDIGYDCILSDDVAVTLKLKYNNTSSPKQLISKVEKLVGKKVKNPDTNNRVEIALDTEVYVDVTNGEQYPVKLTPITLELLLKIKNTFDFNIVNKLQNQVGY